MTVTFKVTGPDRASIVLAAAAELCCFMGWDPNDAVDLAESAWKFHHEGTVRQLDVVLTVRPLRVGPDDRIITWEADVEADTP